MKNLFTFLVVLLSVGALRAQSPIIFQPGPGLNDGTDEGGLNGGKDTYIGDWDALSHYDATTVFTSPNSNCNSTTWIGLMKFDLSSLPSAVDSVFLVFHHLDPSPYCYSNCNADFHMAVVTEAWSETTVSYSNPPAKSTTPFYSKTALNWDDTLGVQQYDITAVYRDWADETVPNHGFQIYSSSIGCNNASVFFAPYSSDDTINGGERRPYLKIYSNSTAINSISAEKFDLKLYPNPAVTESILEFSLNEEENIRFEMFDVSGRILQNFEKIFSPGTNRIIIPMDGYNSGLYFYRLKSNTDSVTGKLIKR
jgi:hypothetical protein